VGSFTWVTALIESTFQVADHLPQLLDLIGKAIHAAVQVAGSSKNVVPLQFGASDHVCLLAPG
jgi:hypothetical protein